MYADYNFYADTYLGTVSEPEHARLAVRAAAHIDRITFGRAKTATGTDLEAVKMAECAVVDELDLQARGGIVTSETNDGISRSYAAGSVVKSNTRRIYDAAAVFLQGTNLLFTGV